MIARILRRRATKQHIEEMLISGIQLKFVLDIESEILPGGGLVHLEGEQMLLEQGSPQENLWGRSFRRNEVSISFRQ